MQARYCNYGIATPPMTANMASPIEAYSALPMEAYIASPPAPEHRARYQIALDAGYLRAELHHRSTTAEMQIFLSTVAGTSKVLGCGRVLISVHSSNPVSMLERYTFLAHLNRLATSPAHKVAIVSAALNPDIADEYIEPFAKQQGVNVRGFADEAAALRWVKDRRYGQDRRVEQHRRHGQDWRLGQDRRYCQVNEWRV